MLKRKYTTLSDRTGTWLQFDPQEKQPRFQFSNDEKSKALPVDVASLENQTVSHGLLTNMALINPRRDQVRACFAGMCETTKY